MEVTARVASSKVHDEAAWTAPAAIRSRVETIGCENRIVGCSLSGIGLHDDETKLESFPKNTLLGRQKLLGAVTWRSSLARALVGNRYHVYLRYLFLTRLVPGSAGACDPSGLVALLFMFWRLETIIYR